MSDLANALQVLGSYNLNPLYTPEEARALETVVAAARRVPDLLNTAQLLKDAIDNPGPQPDYHYRIMERHRREWPTLWRAIDLLMEELDQK